MINAIKHLAIILVLSSCTKELPATLVAESEKDLIQCNDHWNISNRNGFLKQYHLSDTLIAYGSTTEAFCNPGSFTVNKEDCLNEDDSCGIKTAYLECPKPCKNINGEEVPSLGLIFVGVSLPCGTIFPMLNLNEPGDQWFIEGSNITYTGNECHYE